MQEETIASRGIDFLPPSELQAVALKNSTTRSEEDSGASSFFSSYSSSLGWHLCNKQTITNLYLAHQLILNTTVCLALYLLI